MPLAAEGSTARKAARRLLYQSATREAWFPDRGIAPETAQAAWIARAESAPTTAPLVALVGPDELRRIARAAWSSARL